MNLEHVKKSISDICDTHARRLEMALTHIEHLIPLTPVALNSLQDEELGYLEIVTSRYAKLQDTMGAKLFPLILKSLQEDQSDQSFLDILNKLEKLSIIPSAKWWIQIRELRNHVTHEYPDNPELMANNLNKAVASAKELLAYWHDLKKNLHTYKMIR